MIQSFTLYQLYPQIHWPSFFKDWDFDPEFANIASVQGCDVVRASWLTDFEERGNATIKRGQPNGRFTEQGL